MLASFSARPAVHVPEGPIERASATGCNWRWKVSPTTSPSTRSGPTPLAWTWGPLRLPSCPVRGLHAWSCSAPSWLPMPRPFDGSSARWSDSDVPTTRTTTMRAGASSKAGKHRLKWKHSKRYLATRRRKATRERRLAAHRKSLHGRLVHEIVAIGNTVITEKISYRAWQKQFGKSVGLRAPGMFIALLKRTVARTGGTLAEVPTRTTKLSQFCHGCGQLVPKPLWQRWHQCPCGGPIQRDLYSAFLAAYLDPPDFLPSCAQRVRRRLGRSGARPAGSIRASRSTCKCGAAPASLLRYPRVGARLPKVLVEPHKSLFPSCEGKLETWKQGEEPPGL